MDYPRQWPRKQICVAPAQVYDRRRILFDILEKVFPAKFHPFDGQARGWDASVVLEHEVHTDHVLTGAPFPAFVARSQSTSPACSPRQTRFLQSRPGQPYLQGCSILWRQVDPVGTVPVQDGDKVVALADEHPTWTERRNACGFRVVFSCPLPKYDGKTPFLMKLTQGGLLGFLPLLDFLRDVTRPADFDSPPIKACFVFDDPNLHWTSWGYLDYRELIREAEEHDYHAAIATVPIDAWYTNPRAAALFREHPDRISLLMHGVTHTHAELLQPRVEAFQRGELARGLRLIERLEQRHGLRVSRVMAPPHHACSPEACRVMLELGYEAACVSPGWLVQWNPQVSWPPTFGLSSVEFLGGGFPIIPRFNFAGRDDVRIYLAAFFRQPIVLLGHHAEVADGLGVLAETAAKIRALGKVAWCDMTKIARGSLLTKRVGNAFWIRMQSRIVELRIPEGVEEICVDRPWLTADASEPLHFQWSGLPQFEEMGGRVVGGIPANPGALTLRCPPARSSSVASNDRPFLSPVWPLARRILCEARDRVVPLVTRRRKP